MGDGEHHRERALDLDHQQNLCHQSFQSVMFSIGDFSDNLSLFRDSTEDLRVSEVFRLPPIVYLEIQTRLEIPLFSSPSVFEAGLTLSNSRFSLLFLCLDSSSWMTDRGWQFGASLLLGQTRLKNMSRCPTRMGVLKNSRNLQWEAHKLIQTGGRRGPISDEGKRYKKTLSGETDLPLSAVFCSDSSSTICKVKGWQRRCFVHWHFRPLVLSEGSPRIMRRKLLNNHVRGRAQAAGE
jgi:hypothetical protein